LSYSKPQGAYFFGISTLREKYFLWGVRLTVIKLNTKEEEDLNG